MDVSVLSLIRDVLLEVIRMLGPAIVAAGASYLVARAQYRSRIEELERTNEFQAHVKLISIFDEQVKFAAEGARGIKETIGTATGMLAAVNDLEKPLSEDLLTIAGLAGLQVKPLLAAGPRCLHEMRAFGLSEELEYQKLSECLDKLKAADAGPSSKQAVLKKLFDYAEFADWYFAANIMLIDHRRDMLLERYLSSEASEALARRRRASSA